MSSLSSDLYKKYNVPGPRYTSYPTVPYWEVNPTEAQWIASILSELEKSSKAGVGAAVYVHIPFCQSLCTYCGCNTRITRNHAVGNPYIETVLNEWKLYLKRFKEAGGPDSSIPLSELHLGGGTPTFLTADELQRLLNPLLESFKKTPSAEFSVEADPRVTKKDHLETLAHLGFKRLSLGIQDFDPKVQDTVNRVQTEEEVRVVTETARALGYESINYDLIYGLPFQTLKSVEQTLDVVKRLRPDRIAFYGYAHVPWIKPGQRKFTEADLPNGDEKRALYELGRTMLEAEGYQEIGMDHFALKSDSLSKAAANESLHRSFMGYTSRQVAPLIGLGVSAIGDSWGAFAQNEKLLETYQTRVQNGEIPIARGHLLDREDQILRRHILNLMTRFATRWDTAELDTPYLKTIPAKLAELVKDGFLRLTPNSCEITAAGRPFLRNICMAFDARLERKAPATQLFSKTI
ncbi:oxygen-independent coproporphyrinogen III oxidase [bacterium]|jgi:oxygen-independent coproporphyrinogen-3 oxidase|nr:oxygen-independent coproporphyrinogen III oxidase [bacterium]